MVGFVLCFVAIVVNLAHPYSWVGGFLVGLALVALARDIINTPEVKHAREHARTVSRDGYGGSEQPADAPVQWD